MKHQLLKLSKVGAVLASTLCISIQSQGEGVYWEQLIGFDLHFPNSNDAQALDSILYSDNSVQFVNAGDGVGLHYGVLVQTPLYKYDYKLTGGFKYSTSQASNIEVSKIVLPVQAGIRRHIGDGYIGAGAEYQLLNYYKRESTTKYYPSDVGVYVEMGYKNVQIGATFINWRDTDSTLGLGFYQGDDVNRLSANSIILSAEFPY